MTGLRLLPEVSLGRLCLSLRMPWSPAHPPPQKPRGSCPDWALSARFVWLQGQHRQQLCKDSGGREEKMEEKFVCVNVTTWIKKKAGPVCSLCSGVNWNRQERAWNSITKLLLDFVIVTLTQPLKDQNPRVEALHTDRPLVAEQNTFLFLSVPHFVWHPVSWNRIKSASSSLCMAAFGWRNTMNEWACNSMSAHNGNRQLTLQTVLGFLLESRVRF